MMPLCGVPSLVHIVRRLRLCRELDGIAVATSTGDDDDVIATVLAAEGVPVYRGTLADVRGRLLGASRQVGATSIVRVTGDCPLLDAGVVDRVVAAFRVAQPDYACTFLDRREYPRGLDVEVFSVARLEADAQRSAEDREREHVTVSFYENPERHDLLHVAAAAEHRRPELRLTLDTPHDLAVITAIYDQLYPRDPAFGLSATLALLDREPELARANAAVEQRAP